MLTYQKTISQFLKEVHIELGINQEKIIQQAVEMLRQQNIEQEFLNDRENILLLLALGEAWIESDFLENKMVVLQLLKMLAVSREDYTTYSARVRDLSELGYKTIAANFDSQSEVNDEINREIEDLYAEMIVHKNETLSTEINEWLLHGGDTLKLNQAKKSLGINGPNLPFEVAVIDCTIEEMQQRWDCGGMFFSFNGSEGEKPVLVVGHTNGVVNKNNVEHEWNHGQGNWSIGYRSSLFAGFDEAITEYSTPNPHYYQKERNVLGIVFERLPLFKDKVIRAYLGDHDAKVDVEVEIVKTFGLKGLLLLARMLFQTHHKPVSLRQIHLGAEVSDYFKRYHFTSIERMGSQPKTIDLSQIVDLGPGIRALLKKRM